MTAHEHSAACEVPTLERVQNQAAELANDLAELARQREDGRLAALVTGALEVVYAAHQAIEALVLVIGNPRCGEHK